MRLLIICVCVVLSTCVLIDVDDSIGKLSKEVHECAAARTTLPVHAAVAGGESAGAGKDGGQ